MKKAIYIFFSLGVLFIVYFMTYFIELNQKQVSIYNEMMTLTKETHDYESFLRFNSYLHKEIDLNQSNANFDVKAYHIYDRDMDSFLVVFVEVKTNNYATSIDDSNDQTALIASKNGQVIFNSKLNEAFPFDKPFFLILNLAIGGNWGGAQGIDDTIFPASFEIDYVRVYQRDYAAIDKETPIKVANINKAQIPNTIHWQRAFDDYDIEKYAIYVDGKFNGYSSLNQYTLVGLELGKTYNITIEAIDFVGRTSKISDPFVYTT